MTPKKKLTAMIPATHILISLVALLSAIPAIARDDCVKQAFGDVCLGGVASEQSTLPDFRQDWALDYTVEDDIIVAVSGQQQQSGWLEFQKLNRDLSLVYGRGEDRSTLPAYATARNSRERAIQAGRGEAFLEFRAEGYRIELKLVQPLSLTLSYILDQPQPNDRELPL
ncbi:MAG: hypothetical protein HWE20_07385 [Gammaproteobacteria bacterium]|nr:hypothetical protein [Gammaproteobacteria bacterium]